MTIEHEVRSLLDRLGLQAARFTGTDADRTVELPLAFGADYSFLLYLSDYGEHQISARRVGATDGAEMFWFMPFELPDFHKSAQELAKSYLQAVEIVCTHETKILQARGLFFWYFECRYRVGEGGKHLYGLKVRRGLPVAPISGRYQFYSSPALSPNAVSTNELNRKPGAWIVLSEPRRQDAR